MTNFLRKFFHFGIRKQIAIFLGLAIIITSAVITGLNYFIYKGHMLELVEDDALTKLRMKTITVESFLQNQKDRARLLVNRVQLQNNLSQYQSGAITELNLRENLTKILNHALTGVQGVHFVSITDLQGKLLASTSNENGLASHLDVSRLGTMNNDMQLLPPQGEGETYYCDIVTLIRDQNNGAMGFAIIRSSFTELWNLIRPLKENAASEQSAIFRREGNFIRLIMPFKLADGRGPLLPLTQAPEYMKEAIVTDSPRLLHIGGPQGQDQIAQVQRLNIENWTAAIVTDKKFFYGPFYERLGFILGAITLLTLLMLFLSYQFAIQIAMPLINMSKQAKEISKGNFNVSFEEKEAAEGEKDEMDELASSLNSMTKDIKKYIDFRDGFLSLAAHELKTPLSVIQAYLELITMDDYRFQSNKDDYIKSIQRQCKLLNVLITDLLEVSRIQMGRFKLNKKNANLAYLIQNLVTELNSLENKNKIVLLNKVERTIPFDEERIEQVLLSLIANSIKYSTPGSDIFVQMEEIGNNLRISVHDKGVGIPKDKQALIFKQLDQDIQTEPEKRSRTLGISLYVCKVIVEKHDGHIWFESKENVGTSFYFELPLAEASVRPGGKVA